jgi:hypothetical protein
MHRTWTHACTAIPPASRRQNQQQQMVRSHTQQHLQGLLVLVLVLVLLPQ